jgi:hypothetical protein
MNLDTNTFGYYITKDSSKEKTILKPQHIIELSNMDIIELVLPKCKTVKCDDNYLGKLIIPEGCESVNCSYNNLRELIIPKSCVWVSCHNNKLTKLIIPMSCDWISCSENRLHPIIINLFHSDDPVKIQLANSLQIANNL